VRSAVLREQATAPSNRDRRPLSGLDGQLINVQHAVFATLTIDPGKIFTDTSGVTFGKTSDTCPYFKYTQMAHCSRA
jgi:hypothetical protein